jgi:hypothetical protein
MRGGLKRIRLFKLIFLSSRLKKNTKSFDFVYGREQILPASMVNVSIDSFDL